MRSSLRFGAVTLLPAAAIAATATRPFDYGIGVPVGDNPAPAIAALLHGNLAALAGRQTVMGLGSIVLRAPFVALARLLGGGLLLQYQLGLFACAAVAGTVAAAAIGPAIARGRSPLGATAIAMLIVLNLMTIGNRLLGHPEELLGGALCVAAVLAAIGGRPLVAGVALGAAIGCKEWALLAVVPAWLACGGGRRRMLLAAAAVAAPLGLALPLANPAAFTRATTVIGDLRHTSPLSWWWLVRTGAMKLPLGLTRAQVAWLAPALSVPIGFCYQRRRIGRDPADALGLLALLLLLRCALDPSFLLYYAVPCLSALVAWELLTRPGLPVASLAAITVCWWLGHFYVVAPEELIGLLLTVGLTLYLGARVVFGVRSVSARGGIAVELPCRVST